MVAFTSTAVKRRRSWSSRSSMPVRPSRKRHHRGRRLWCFRTSRCDVPSRRQGPQYHSTDTPRRQCGLLVRNLQPGLLGTGKRIDSECFDPPVRPEDRGRVPDRHAETQSAVQAVPHAERRDADRRSGRRASSDPNVLLRSNQLNEGCCLLEWAVC